MYEDQITVNMFQVFLWLVQGLSCRKPTVSSKLTIVPRFSNHGTPSRTGLQREYANYENGL